MELRARVPEGPIEEKWDSYRFDMKLVNPANKRKYTIIMVGSDTRTTATPSIACSTTR